MKQIRSMSALTALAAASAVAVAGPASAEPQSGAASAGTKKDIVETAVGAGQFGTLASLLKKAGLVKTLKGKGPYTVFAPTDAAFAKVPQATLDELGQDKA
ncbi:MAG TPA: fasciclin domain-containing protein, partial [Solirubrobacteraceae bacterium]|nr:fasciclin domain-containing protein [Solirubrobacteraceae bacterium]